MKTGEVPYSWVPGVNTRKPEPSASGLGHSYMAISTNVRGKRHEENLSNFGRREPDHWPTGSAVFAYNHGCEAGWRRRCWKGRPEPGQ